MNGITVSGARTKLILASLAAVSLGMTGCEHFRWVKRPVTAGPGHHPELVQPPPDFRVEPNPDPQPEPQPKPEPRPEPRPDPPKPLPGPRPTAIAVPGKPGFVFSPYNNKLIDVQGYAPGTLVADPTYPMSERKFFRVP